MRFVWPLSVSHTRRSAQHDDARSCNSASIVFLPSASKQRRVDDDATSPPTDVTAPTAAAESPTTEKALNAAVLLARNSFLPIGDAAVRSAAPGAEALRPVSLMCPLALRPLLMDAADIGLNSTGRPTGPVVSSSSSGTRTTAAGLLVLAACTAAGGRRIAQAELGRRITVGVAAVAAPGVGRTCEGGGDTPPPSALTDATPAAASDIDDDEDALGRNRMRC